MIFRFVKQLEVSALRAAMLVFVMSFFSVNIFADFTLTHQKGAYDELQANGMQSVHSDYQILYAKPGDSK